MSYLQAAIPSGGRRSSEKVTTIVEPGGPGLIISKILQKTENDSILVTKIGDDVDGKKVLGNINGSNTLGNVESAKIFTHFIEMVESNDFPGEFKTWESIILEPNDNKTNRVFMNRPVENKILEAG